MENQFLTRSQTVLCKQTKEFQVKWIAQELSKEHSKQQNGSRSASEHDSRVIDEQTTRLPAAAA